MTNLPPPGSGHNQDSNNSIPSPFELNNYQNKFLFVAEQAFNTGSLEYLEAFSQSNGQFILHGVIRRLDTNQKVELIKKTLPLIKSNHSFAVNLIEKTLDASINMLEFSEVVQAVGYELLATATTPSGKAIFSERIIIAQCAQDLKGIEFLITPNKDDINTQYEALEKLDLILRHNASLFESTYTEEPITHPMAINAQLLLSAFQESKYIFDFANDDLYDFVLGWNEKVTIHAATGLGIYDKEDLKLNATELQQVREAIFRFPPSIILFRGVLLRIDFSHAVDEDKSALGAFNLGRIFLYSQIRNALPGIDFPQNSTAMHYTTVHECAHSCHTYCMEDFRKLSGWVAVRNYTLYHPISGEQFIIKPDDFKRGSKITIDGEVYTVADYEEPSEYSFSFGDDTINIENPDVITGCGWIYKSDSRFISEYAKIDPLEDYAESLTHFLLMPNYMKVQAPIKYDFMNYLYGKII